MEIVHEEKDNLSNGTPDSIEEGIKLAAPQPGGPMMSLVSRKYDTTGKGYLDPTEQALRRMDSQNLGFLTPDKVYKIMQQLQEEHSRSHELIRELHEQTNKTLSLKKAVYALLAFSVLLALSNIGTSFAAARLAKDTSIEGTDMVAINTNTRVATTPKYVEVMLTPLDESRRKLRHLQDQIAMEVCADINTATTACEIQPEVSLEDAEGVYRQFCPDYQTWTTTGTRSCNTAGVSQLTIYCNGETTMIQGGTYFPKNPNILPNPDSTGSIIFPGANNVYYGVQTKRSSSATIFSSLAAMPAGSPCSMHFQFAMYCNINTRTCLPFLSYAAEDVCPSMTNGPQLCGSSSAASS